MRYLSTAGPIVRVCRSTRSQKNYTVTTRLRSFTFEIAPSDPPFLGQACRVRQVVCLARKLIPSDGREHFGMFFLNGNLDVLGYHELAIGTLSSVLLSPREVYSAVFKSALGCRSIILVHNHPSGNPRPSRADITLTKQIIAAGKILDVPLTDHVILGEPGHVSLAERRGVFPLP